MSTGERSRTPDGRRGGPIAVGEPAKEERDQVAQLTKQSAERRQRELEEQQAAAEPAGVPPSEEQRAAVDQLRDRSAELRGPAARALRRQPVAVGTIYDDEREDVEDLLADAREARLDELKERGIVDPAVEQQTAGFDPDLPGLPGHELYGVFACPNCGTNVERSFPGYVDWDLASRDVVCPNCGGVVKRGGAAAPSEAAPEQQPPTAEAEPVVQTSAQPAQTPAAAQSEQTAQTAQTPPTSDAGASSAPLTDDERAELEQLRRERAERQVDTGAPTARRRGQQAQQPPPANEQPPSG